MKIYTIYDSKADAHTQPFFAQDAAVATRMFERAAMNKDHTMHTHPFDFTLFELGDWNEKTAVIKPLRAAKSIINAAALPMWQAGEGN